LRSTPLPKHKFKHLCSLGKIWIFLFVFITCRYIIVFLYMYIIILISISFYLGRSLYLFSSWNHVLNSFAIYLDSCIHWFFIVPFKFDKKSLLAFRTSLLAFRTSLLAFRMILFWHWHHFLTLIHIIFLTLFLSLFHVTICPLTLFTLVVAILICFFDISS